MSRHALKGVRRSFAANSPGRPPQAQREYRHFETNLGWRPHAVANGTTAVLRLPFQPVAPGFNELTPFWPGA
jgi:hypothetical protein